MAKPCGTCISGTGKCHQWFLACIHFIFCSADRNCQPFLYWPNAPHTKTYGRRQRRRSGKDYEIHLVSRFIIQTNPFYLLYIEGKYFHDATGFDAAERHLKKSSSLGAAMPEAEGANKLQLGMMALQKGDFRSGESYMRAAIRLGIPDKESEAVAYLSMCQIFMNKREFRAAKDFFRKAKACKPTTKQVVDQIKDIEKYISRMPG